MEKINWGIIGCGDVTEVKSGPAFNKVNNSMLVAVMRRDGAKAKDYATRHGVPVWYDDASLLINDPAVNAIYIATPPSTHEMYTLAAIEAGKPVYVEKPMTLNFAAAKRMAEFAAEKNVKLSVAHYRRAQPLFKKIKQLLDEKAIGDIRLVRLDYFKMPLAKAELELPKVKWRLDPAVSGGGLFHDIAPHQLDLMFYFFGAVGKAVGIAVKQSLQTNVQDVVAGNILFKNGVAFSGSWCFNVAAGQERDYCDIIGSTGKIGFSVFDAQPVLVTTNDTTTAYNFDALPHVQQPMIEQVTNYFLNKIDNPCSGDEGAVVMKIIDAFTQRSNW
jgi:predicted dehydrogenase